MLRQLFTGGSKNNFAVAFQHQLTNPTFVRHYSDNPDYGKQLGGYEYREPDGFRSLWRKPLRERKGFWISKFEVFGGKSFAAGLTRYNLDNLKYMSFKQWWGGHEINKIIYNQQVIEERTSILGSELAAAHFVVYRGGAVKFYNHTNWIKDDKEKREYDDDLPNVHNPDYVLEAIDLSGTLIVYEGLRNLDNLRELKWLSFAYCRYFDNWCLDRLSGEHSENLEYLDISFTNVTYSGLNALYRFRKLKTLKVDDMSEDPEFIVMCTELNKCLPELNIEKISFETQLDKQETKNVLSQS